LTTEQLIQLWERTEEEFNGRAPKAMTLSPIAAAHRILTNSMGALPADLYKKENGRRVSVDSHPTLYPLTVRANMHMSPFLFKKIMESKCFWYGEAFAYIDRAQKNIELIPLPDRPEFYEDNKGGRWYLFSGDEKNIDLTRKFHEDELIHIYFENGDGKRGTGILDMAKQAISTDLNAQKYAGKFYKQGARPSGVIEVPTKMDQQNKEKVRKAFERAVGGMDNAFRVAVMDLGMKYTQLGISQRDAQFIESRQFTVEEVARFTGIPLHKLQSGKQSYESNEAQGIEYVINTLRPRVIQWEEELRYKLLTPMERENMYYRFNLAAEMRGDNASRSAFYQRMVGYSIMTPNECRRLEEMNDDPNGDELLATKNLTTLKTLVKGGETNADN
jgi:HK97 family phage portal protein